MPILFWGGNWTLQQRDALYEDLEMWRFSKTNSTLCTDSVVRQFIPVTPCTSSHTFNLKSADESSFSLHAAVTGNEDTHQADEH